MSKDFIEDKATKEQSNSALFTGVTLILGIALIVSIAQSVPVWVSVAIAVPIVGFIAFHVVRFIKRTWFTSRHEDGGSSVK